MSPQQIWELIGYIGSAIVLVSLLMSSVIKLRILNTIGSFIFCIYAIAIHSYPTAVMNGALVVIDLYYLIKILRTQKSFSVVEAGAEDASVTHFLAENAKDIEKYFPGYEFTYDARIYLVYQDMTIAGVFIGAEHQGTLDVVLDYSTPSYRDCSVGKTVYSQLKNLNFKKLTYSGTNEVHKNYLKKMGFVQEQDRLIKEL